MNQPVPQEGHPQEAPVYYARASEWTVRPSPWAAADEDDDEDDDWVSDGEAAQNEEAEEDEYDDEEDEDRYAPVEPLPPPPPAPFFQLQPVPRPRQPAAMDALEHPVELQNETPINQLRIPPPPIEPPPRTPLKPMRPAPDRRSSATAWWIAVGVIIVALAVAAGVLVGLNLAQRDRSGGVPGATCNGHAVLRTTDGCNLVDITPQGPAVT